MLQLIVGLTGSSDCFEHLRGRKLLMPALDYSYMAELVVNAQGGDSDAFAELYAATYQKQYQFAYSYLKDGNIYYCAEGDHQTERSDAACGVAEPDQFPGMLSTA